jgi:hypothetical protein
MGGPRWRKARARDLGGEGSPFPGGSGPQLAGMTLFSGSIVASPDHTDRLKTELDAWRKGPHLPHEIESDGVENQPVLGFLT